MTAFPPPAPDPLRIATRESRLALWQAGHVRDLLAAQGGDVPTLLGITTLGDRILDRTLSAVGGKGLFVKELETSLAEGRAQLAVHSLKDVPMALPDGFVISAILPREDARDAWVSPRHPHWRDLPAGACVGTSSLRRMAQLRAARQDLDVQPLRGNLDTRLRKLDDGQYDGIVLAVAGLVRLGLVARIRARIDVDEMLPAAGQGALGIEVRADAPPALQERVAALDDAATWVACHAEREVSRRLGGSCSMPLAAYATWQDGALVLRARLGHLADPTRPMLAAESRLALSVPPVGDDAARADATRAAEALGRDVADRLHDAGANDYLAGHLPSAADAAVDR